MPSRLLPVRATSNVSLLSLVNGLNITDLVIRGRHAARLAVHYMYIPVYVRQLPVGRSSRTI